MQHTTCFCDILATYNHFHSKLSIVSILNCKKQIMNCRINKIFRKHH